MVYYFSSCFLQKENVSRFVIFNKYKKIILKKDTWICKYFSYTIFIHLSFYHGVTLFKSMYDNDICCV